MDETSMNAEIIISKVPNAFVLSPGQIAIILNSEKDLQTIQEAMIIADDTEATDFYEPFIKNAQIIKG